MYKTIEELVTRVDERNNDGIVSELIGVSIDKCFIKSVANTNGTDLSKYKIIRKNDFAVSLMQVSRDGKIPVARLEEYEEAIMSPAYPIFRVKDKNIILPEYLEMWFKRPEFDREAAFIAVGGVRGSMPWEEFAKMKLPVPPIEKQRKIVNAYKIVTDRIALKQKINDNLVSTLQSIYKKMFLESQNTYMTTPLADLCSKIGSGATPKGGKAAYFDKGISLIRSMNVFDYFFSYPELAHISQIQANALANVEIQQADVLFNITGVSVTRCCVVPDDVLPARVNQHVMIIRPYILLPIEAESQDTALRIFSTLNDRGKPLSDADIFKAQFYKHFSKLGKKEEFIAQWKKLEELCERIFHPISGTPMDELFTRYMYFVRAKMGIVSSTTEALRKFYEKNSYALLKDTNTLTELIVLAEFWEDVSNQDTERFSNRVLKQFFVLNYAPNGMWTYFVSVYFMQNKDDEGLLDDEKFYTFLQKITGFIWTYAITNPGVNALRTPVYAEMVNIVNDKPVEFSKYKFDADTIRSMFDNFSFNNARPITKAMIAWWAYQNDKQPLLSLETTFEIEHIYARNRNEKENSLTDARNVESLGNKALLEKRINIRASDYRFTDKKKYYEGFTNSKGQIKEGTGVVELLDLTATSADFTENDIIDRYKKMIDCFINYLQKNSLIK